MGPADICNVGLARVGVTAFISALTDTSKEAAVCRLFYDFARRATLAEFPWRFATKRTQLAILSTDTQGWTYSYALPPDFIGVTNYEKSFTGVAIDLNFPPYRILDLGTGKVLVTDWDFATAFTYTADIEETLLFPPLFIDAMAWRLAQELVTPLRLKPELIATARQMYIAALGVAAAADAGIKQQDLDQDPSHIQARR